MSKHKIFIFAMFFLLLGLNVLAWYTLPANVGAARFMQYDDANKSIEPNFLDATTGFDPDEFYDSDIYVVDSTGETWTTWLEYLPESGDIGQDRICLQKEGDAIEATLLPTGSYAKPTIAKADPNTAWFTYETQEQCTIHWSLNHDLLDSIGDYHGTWGDSSNDPVYVADSGHYSLVFDGVNDYIEIDGDNGTAYKGVGGSNPRTCTAWVKTTSSSSYPMIMSWGTFVPRERKAWSFSLTPDGKLRLGLFGGNVTGSTAVNDGQWHHVAVVLGRDISGSNGYPDGRIWVEDVQFYVDGVLDTNPSFSTNSLLTDPEINTSTDMNVTIGARNLGGGTYEYPYYGRMDDVRIYNQALDASEISYLSDPNNLANGTIGERWQIKLMTSDPAGNYSYPLSISQGRGNCINHSIAQDPNSGDIWVVWQEDVYGQFEIKARKISNSGTLGKIYTVSTNPLGDWRPNVAVTADGKVCVVWDSYFKYNVDVYTGDDVDSFNVLARWYDPDTDSWSQTFIAPHPTDPNDPNTTEVPSAFQGYAQVVADPYDGDTVWVLWEEGKKNWGGEYHKYPDDPEHTTAGSWSYDDPATLHNYRKLRIGKLQIDSQNNTQFYEAAKLPMASFDLSSTRLDIDDPDYENHLRHGVFYEKGKLVFDNNGRLWVFYRHFYNNYCMNEDIYQAHYKSGWQVYGCYADDSSDGWSDLYTFKEPIFFDESPVAYWRLDESTGLTASDSSDNGNDGTLVNMDNADWVTGIYGNALDFDGVNDYVSIPSANILETGTQLTASAWIKTTDSSTEYGTIVGTGDAGWVLARKYNGLIVGFWLTTGFVALENNTVTVADGNWHHVVTVYDGSMVYLHVDGKMTSTNQKWGGGTIAPGGSIKSSGYSVNIGKNPRTEATDSDPRYWNGLIDDVKIYGQALTHDQVYQSMAPTIYSNYHMRDGMQRFNLSAGVDGLKLTWTVGRTDRLNYTTDSVRDGYIILGSASENFTSKRGVVVSEIAAEENAPSEDPNVTCTDPNLVVFDDPNIIETTEPNVIVVGDQSYTLVMGDVHRHTDLSECQNYREGSTEDAYRYAIEVADLDYMAITDHDIDTDDGNLFSQVWWRKCKEVTRYRLQNTFMPLYGNERRCGGHQNVISLDPDRLRSNDDPYANEDPQNNIYFWDNVCRDGRVFTIPHGIESGLSGVIPRIPVNTYTNTINAQYDHARCLWEIYQGCRDFDPSDVASGILSRQENGVRQGLQDNQHFGFIGSSDHGSTNRSFACVWTPDVSTEGIFKSMKARRTYAATDKIYLDFRIGDHMMGERFEDPNLPEFYVDIQAPSNEYAFDKIYLVYEDEYGNVQREPVDQNELGDYCDINTLIKGNEDIQSTIDSASEYFFYVEAIEDTDTFYSNRAWSSPIWWVKPESLEALDLVHHWELDGNTEDTGLLLNHGICMGDPNWVVDEELGNCLEFDGVDDGVEFAGSCGIGGSNPRTCAAWVKTSSYGSAQMIMSWGASEHKKCWGISLDPDGKLHVFLFGGTVTGSTFISDGQWHYVAVVLNGDIGGPDGYPDGYIWKEDIQLYVDGILEENVSYTQNPEVDPDIDTSTDMNITIGVRNYGGTPYGYTYEAPFSGRIADVQIYDRALGKSEILTNCVVNLTSHQWFTNIQDAVDDANDFDEIVVYPGTYHESVDVNARITLRGSDPNDWDIVEATVIDGDPWFSVASDNSAASGTVVEGLTLTGGMVGIDSEVGITIKNCISRDNSSGISVSAYSDPVEISNCKITGNVNGINCYALHNGTVEDNWIYGNDNGIRVEEPSNFVIRNNTIVDNTSYGISSSYATAVPIYNCILWNNGDDLDAIFNATYSCIEDSDSEPTNIHTDPNFVDASNDDYHLSSGSLCIDAGDPNGVYTSQVDIDGEDRVIGDDVDMGADEYN